MRETRMIVVSDLFGTEFVLCITNLDNTQLQTMLVRLNLLKILLRRVQLLTISLKQQTLL